MTAADDQRPSAGGWAVTRAEFDGYLAEFGRRSGDGAQPLATRDLAEVLGVLHTTAAGWARRGWLTGGRGGRKSGWKFTLAQVQLFLATHFPVLDDGTPAGEVRAPAGHPPRGGRRHRECPPRRLRASRGRQP